MHAVQSQFLHNQGFAITCRKHHHESKNLNLDTDSDVISAKDDSAMVLPSDKDVLPKNGKTCFIVTKCFSITLM